MTVVVRDDLSTADGAQLERWAYGRSTTSDEDARAVAALAELHRRAAAELAQREAAALERAHLDAAERGAAGAHTRGRGDIDGEGSADADTLTASERRHRRRMLITGISGVTAAALALGAGVVALNQPAPDPLATSLDVFERAVPREERTLAALLEREGTRVSVGPRSLGLIGYGEIVAYRSLVSSSGVVEPTLDLVCVSVAECNKRLQNTLISDSTCIARAKFDAHGISTTLYGVGGQYDVDWGPVGEARLDVLISESQRLAMEPNPLGVFIDVPASELAQHYVAHQLLLEQTGIIINDLRTLLSVTTLLDDDHEGLSDLPPDSEWLVAYIGIARDGTDEQACLAVVADGVQIESSCLALAEMDSRTLTLEVFRGAKRIVLTWSSRGELTTRVTESE